MEQIIQTTTCCIRSCCLILLSLLWASALQAQSLDVRILNEVHLHRNRSLDDAMNGISQTAYPVSLAVPLVQWLHGFAGHHQQSLEYGLQSATALIITTGVVYGLKYTVDRKRPYEEHPEYDPYSKDSSPSFPSGHTSFAFATATSLSIEYPRWYVIVPSYLWAGAIGYSRLHLGEHYPGDVVAGALIGAASAYISYEGNKWLRTLWRKKTAQHFSLVY